MPEVQPKAIHQDLKNQQIWPVYWLYGPEPMKARELLKRIRRAVLGEATEESSNRELTESILDGNEVTGQDVREEAQNLSMFGGVQFIVVRDAHQMKNPEAIEPLFHEKKSHAELSWVCVFLAKNLDKRKKFSKTILEKAAVVPCHEIQEHEREAWIQYLFRRRGMTPQETLAAQLQGMEPWSLDLIEQEIEKYQMARESSLENPEAVLQTAAGTGTGSHEDFPAAFYEKNRARAFQSMKAFARQPEDSMPMLGLLAWNTRQLALFVHAKQTNLQPPRMSGFLKKRFEKWQKHWHLAEIQTLQKRLLEMDYALKQTRALPIALWSELITEFCGRG